MLEVGFLTTQFQIANDLIENEGANDLIEDESIREHVATGRSKKIHFLKNVQFQLVKPTNSKDSVYP